MASTKPPTIMIHEVTGDILAADVEALVNPVNTRGVMGAGLALQFKRIYPMMAESYVNRCRQGKVTLGKMSVWSTGMEVYPHYIINFPTKDHWTQPSRLEWVESGLVSLRYHIICLQIKSIAIPRLGCGLGELRWADVQTLINAGLSDLPTLDIFLYSRKKEPIK